MGRTKQRPIALIVSDDPGLRDGVARWLEVDGFEAMECPGPRAPHFSCVGLEGKACPLARGAEVVVLDLHPEPGMQVDSTSRTKLVGLYHDLGRPVVAMVDEAASLPPNVDGVSVVSRLSQRGDLLATVRQRLAIPQ